MELSSGSTPSRRPRLSVDLPARLRDGLSAKHLPALDGLRAVAAFLVVFYHVGLLAVPGGLGVLVFFVLSGFLITWLLLLEHERTGTVSLRQFYLRRSLRIFPAFYAYAALLLVALIVMGKRVVWSQVIASLLYVNNYYQALNGDPNTGFSHTWSLGVEEQFYIFWPLLFVFIAVQRRVRSIELTLIAAIVAVWLHRLFLVSVGANQGYIYESFDTRADHLLIGCLLATSLKNGRVIALWRWLCAHAVLPALTIGALVVSTYFAGRGGVQYRDTIGFIIDPLLVAVLIVQLITHSSHGVWRVWNLGWVRYLGRISYSVYLYQQIVPGYVEKVLRSFPPGVQMAGAIIGVIVVASGSYYFVERPFLKIKDRLASRQARVDAEQVVASGDVRYAG